MGKYPVEINKNSSGFLVKSVTIEPQFTYFMGQTTG